MGTGVPFPDIMDSILHPLSLSRWNVVQNFDIIHETSIWTCNTTKLVVSLTFLFLQYTLPWIQAHPQSGSWHWQDRKSSRRSHQRWLKKISFRKPREGGKISPIFYSFQPKRSATHRNWILKWRSNSNCKYLGILLSISAVIKSLQTLWLQMTEVHYLMVSVGQKSGTMWLDSLFRVSPGCDWAITSRCGSNLEFGSFSSKLSGCWQNSFPSHAFHVDSYISKSTVCWGLLVL